MRSPLLAGVLLISLILALAIGVVFLMRSAAIAAPIEALPRDTSLLVRVQNPAALWRDLSRTTLATSGEEIPSSAIDLLTPPLNSLGITLPVEARAFLAGSEREAILALVPGDANTPAGIVVVLDVGTASHDFPRQAQQALHPAVATTPDQDAASWTSRSHHGREYLTMRPATGGSLHIAGVKGLGILSTTGAAMRRVLDTLDGRTEPLAAEPAYRATRDRLGRKAGVLAWASGAWAIDRMERAFQGGDERRVLRLLGLEAISGAGLEVDIRGGMFRERLFLAMKGDQRGLPAELMAGPATAHRASHVVPAMFPFYLSISCSHLDAVYRRLPEILASATGGDRRDLRSRLEGAEKFMALDLASGLLAALGDEMVVGFGRSSPWPRGAPERRLLETPAVASIGVTNRTKLAEFLARADGLARALSSYEAIEQDGRTVTSYNLPSLAPLRPAYRMTAGRWTAATSPELLGSALAAGAHQGSWADLPGMEELLGQLPDRSHALLVADSERVADLFAWTRGFVALSAARLPPMAATARMTTSGLQLDAVGPISPSLVLALWLGSRDAAQTATEDSPRPGVDETIPY